MTSELTTEYFAGPVVAASGGGPLYPGLPNSADFDLVLNEGGGGGGTGEGLMEGVGGGGGGGGLDGLGVTPPANTSMTGVENATVLLLRQEPWVVPLLAAAATNMAAIIGFEVFVLVRAVHGTPSRRHLFLGQCLLLGLLLCSLAGLPVAMTPTATTCAVTRLLVGVSTALVFATLLVKCVFLISLNSGVYLPAHYQALLLFFVVLVQITISTQWLCSSPPGVRVSREAGGFATVVCATTYRDTLLALLYVILLLVAVASLAVKCRGIRENYREASYIGAALGLVVPLWSAWCLAGLVVPQPLQDACLGFGVVTSASIIFVIMYIPKGRQLSAVGKDGLYREDREDRLSTMSGARYSPSFFLFKPAASKPPTKDTPTPASRTQNPIYKTHLSDLYEYGVVAPKQKQYSQYNLQHLHHQQQSHQHFYHHHTAPAAANCSSSPVVPSAASPSSVAAMKMKYHPHHHLLWSPQHYYQHYYHGPRFSSGY